ncbi:MAG: serine/threonine-protein kinase [Myxococcaceae bacterium]
MTAAPFQTNQRFGQYVLVSPIAVGGMAEVWLAKLDGPQGFQKKVALKRMTGTLSDQKQFVDLFLDEARLMSALAHPNIAQVFELGERDESFYVAMEFIDGQTVQHVMRAVTRANQRLPVELAVKIARDAADALHYAHTKADDEGKPLNIIHRDVSPQNLMVTYEGVPKLLDFGIAKAATRSNATEAGQLRGKLSYMPPEQARGELIDHRVDQFALGVVLFEMLTHTRLYPALKEMDLFRIVATKTEPYETAKQREPSVPEEISAIVAKMMDRDAANRYSNMAEVRDVLTGYLHSISQTMPSNEQLGLFMKATFPPEARLQMPVKTTGSFPAVGSGFSSGGLTNPKKKKRLVAGLSALGVVGVAFVAWALWPSAPEPVKPVVEAPKVDPPKVDPPKDPPPPVDVPDAAVALAPVDPIGDPDDLEPLEFIDAGTKGKKGTAVAPKGKGKLSLQTSPWSNVFFGKKNLGETPLVNVPLPAGKLRLTLINDDRKLKTTIEVEIKPNQTTSLKLKL